MTGLTEGKEVKELEQQVSRGYERTVGITSL